MSHGGPGGGSEKCQKNCHVLFESPLTWMKGWKKTTTQLFVFQQCRISVSQCYDRNNIHTFLKVQWNPIRLNWSFDLIWLKQNVELNGSRRPNKQLYVFSTFDFRWVIEKYTKIYQNFINFISGVLNYTCT